MRTRSLLAAATLVLLAGPATSAHAQTSGYVSGVLFADVQRSSGQPNVPSYPYGAVVSKLDGTAIGGGVRGGVFLAPRLTLELGVDLGGPIDQSSMPQILPLRTGGLTFPPGVTIPGYVLPQYAAQIRTKTTATSVLLAYHPPARGRLRAGFAGGLTFVRTSTTLTDTISYVFVGNAIVPPPLVAPITTTTDVISHQVAATVGGELAIELARRASLVPEIRAHGFDNRFVLRPGVGFRWHW